MNDDLRRSLDRAAGEDPQIDLTEAAWSGGRILRRRRHAAQGVGGMVAAAVLAGAFALGGGVLSEPNSYDGPARPTVDDTAIPTTATVTTTEQTSEEASDQAPPVETSQEPTQEPTQDPPAQTRPEQAAPVPTTPGDDAPEPTPTETSAAPLTGADGVLVLSADAIEGHPLDGSVKDLVAAVTAELGEPEVLLGSVATDCNAEPPYGDLYSWGVLEITVSDDGMGWGLDSWADLPVEVDLPGALEIGMTIEEVRSAEIVVAEHTDLSGRPVLELSNGVAVFVSEGAVFRVVHRFRTIC